MKSRIFVLITVLAFATAMVALSLSIVHGMTPGQADQADPPTAFELSPALAADASVGDSFKLPVVDRSNFEEPDPVAAPKTAAASSPEIDSSDPWHPPFPEDLAAQSSQSLANRMTASTSAAHIPVRRTAQQQPARYGSPVEQAGLLSEPAPRTEAPVVDLNTESKIVPSGRISPEALEELPAGFTVDVSYNALMGYVSPGDLVTATVSPISAYGSARADGAGLFFTPFWQTNGQPLDLQGGETIEVYINGVWSQSITVPAFTGEMSVLTDRSPRQSERRLGWQPGHGQSGRVGLGLL